MTIVDPDVSEDTLSAAGMIVGSVLMLGISAWVIHQKGRSIWWILLSGWFSPLWLSDHRSLEKNPELRAKLLQDELVAAKTEAKEIIVEGKISNLSRVYHIMDIFEQNFRDPEASTLYKQLRQLISRHE
jgi:hypothetical protein